LRRLSFPGRYSMNGATLSFGINCYGMNGCRILKQFENGKRKIEYNTVLNKKDIIDEI